MFDDKVLDGSFPVQDCNFLGSGNRNVTGVDSGVYREMEDRKPVLPDGLEIRPKNDEGKDE